MPVLLSLFLEYFYRQQQLLFFFAAVTSNLPSRACAGAACCCCCYVYEQVDAAAESIASDRITPVFAVSNVSGAGLPLLRAFVARLRRNKARNDDPTMQVNLTTGQGYLSIGSGG